MPSPSTTPNLAQSQQIVNLASPAMPSAPPPPQSQYPNQQYGNNGQKMPTYPTPEQQQQFMQNYAYLQANNPAAQQQQQRMALYFSNNAQNFNAAGSYQLIGIPAQQYNPNAAPPGTNAANAQQQQDGPMQYAAGAQSQANISTLWQMCQQDYNAIQMAHMPQMINAPLLPHGQPPQPMPVEMYHQQMVQQPQMPAKSASTTTSSPLNTATEEDSGFISEKHESASVGKTATGAEAAQIGKDETSADLVDDFHKKMSMGKVESKRAFTDTQLMHDGTKEHVHHHHQPHNHSNSQHGQYNVNRKHGAAGGPSSTGERSYSSYDSHSHGNNNQSKDGGNSSGGYYSNMKYNTLSNKKYTQNKFHNSASANNNYRQNSNSNSSQSGHRAQNSATSVNYQGGGYRQSKSSTASIASLQGNSPQQTVCRFGNACKFKKMGKCRYLHNESPISGASISAAHSIQNIASAQDNARPRSTDFEPQQQQQQQQQQPPQQQTELSVMS